MRGIPRRAVAANLPIAGSKARAADIADTKSICSWNTDMYGIDMSKNAVPLLKYAERIFSRPAYIEALTPSEKVMRK